MPEALLIGWLYEAAVVVWFYSPFNNVQAILLFWVDRIFNLVLKKV